jgi:hypothetical protein
MKYIKIIALLFVISIFFNACSRYSDAVGPEVTTTESKLKVINTATNYSSLSAKIDNNSIQTLSFESLIPYQTLTDGVHKMMVKSQNNGDSLHHENDLTNGTAYTWFILDGTPLRVLPAVDNNTAPASGKSKVRVSNFSNVDTIDIKIAGSDNLITGVNNGAVWGYAAVNSGTYNLEIRTHSTGELLYTGYNIDLRNQGIYDLVVTGYKGDFGQREIRFKLYNQ